MESGEQEESRYVTGNALGCPASIATDPPDIQLIQRFQAGDSGVFDLLYLRYHDRIYGVIRSIISNREDALDITQDVFLKAYQGLGNFKRTSQFYSWLYRITINRCIDFMRRRSKHSVLYYTIILYPMKSSTLSKPIDAHHPLSRLWNVKNFVHICTAPWYSCRQGKERFSFSGTERNSR